MKIIGRNEEISLLETLCSSPEPEFLALYGRRRVGKTFLIRQFFREKKGVVFFNVTGAKDAPMSEQIEHFTKQMGDVFYNGIELQPGKNWDKSFEMLTRTFKDQVAKKIILFFDELPWMATRNSRFLQLLDYYWNQHWSNDPRIKLIICGSSSSWMIEKVIHDKGGLHNRVTKELYLEPFNLMQTKSFLHKKGVKLNHQQILLLFMVTGGVPYYLTKVQKGLSAAQIIEDLAFSRKAFFLEEFDKLFSSLFDQCELYISVIRVIAENRYGIGERALLEKIGKRVVGATGKKILNELEQSGFIMSFKPIYNKRRGIYYRLVDEYTLFYLRWIEPIRASLEKEALDDGYWQAMQSTPAWYSWLGYSFESVCYKHLSKIKAALKLGPTAMTGTWRYVPTKASKDQGAQIDLLFDRQDDAVTLCEIKYTDSPFVLTKDYVDNLNRKANVFKARTHCSKQIFIALISAHGVKNNYYVDDMISGVVTLADFF